MTDQFLALDPATGLAKTTPLPPGGVAPIEFNQVSPSAAWHIVHGQGSDPAVTVVRDNGVTQGGFGRIYSPDKNTVDLYFGEPIRGLATLNF